MKTQYVQKNLRFPAQVVQVLEKEAEQYGYSFNQMVQHIVVERVSNKLNADEEIITDPKVIKSIKKALDDYKKGEYVELKTLQNIDDFFDNL